MSILASRYGFARPRSVSSMLRALQVALPCVPIIEAAPAVAPQPAIARKDASIEAMQSERAQLRADLAFMRHYYVNFDGGPTLEEIAALESRLDALDDYLIFEPETAMQLPLLAA